MIKNQILELIKENPKTYVKKVKSDPNMLGWVTDNSLIESSSLPAMIYSALTSTSNVCKNGNIRKFDRISTGFVGCGPASMCKCTRDSISEKVTATKSNTTREQTTVSNNKRDSTMMMKYGVLYNSQRTEIKELLSKPKTSEQVQQKLLDYTWLNEQYNIKNRTLVDIAAELGVYYSTVGSVCIKFGFSIRQTSNYSLVEQQIKEFIEKLGINVEQHNWSILGSKEIDLFIPDRNLGIEINGLYWHSWAPGGGKNENKFKHLDKTKAAKERGVDLIHITDYEWINKREIIENLILTKLGKNAKIHARKCTLGIVDKQTEINFLKKYHLQGHVASKDAFGLYFNNELIMLLTIGHNRFGNNTEKEILRLCSKHGVTVVGGVSKLLKYAIEILNTTLITYCDADKSNANGYLAAGMKKIQEPSPGYFWTNGTNIISRYKAQKSQLKNWLPNFNTSLSESENMFLSKYRRYWTCGNYKLAKYP